MFKMGRLLLCEHRQCFPHETTLLDAMFYANLSQFKYGLSV